MEFTKTLQLIRSKIIYYTLYLVGKTPEQMWKKKLAVLLVGVPEDKLKIYETVLNNQHRYIQQCVVAYPSPHGWNDKIDSERITKLVLDSLTTMDIIGVQPIEGPVGLLFHLTVKTSDTSDNTEQRMSLEVTSQAIEAQTRKLAARWTIEAAQDLNNMHDLDIGAELESALAQEVATEITLEHVKDLVALSEKQEIVVGSAGAIVHIKAKCSDIARETRRGAGNRLIMSPVLFARLNLKNNPEFAAEELKAGEMRGPTSLLYVGTLNKSIKVYVSVYGSGIDDNTALIGYKGMNEIDVGYIFAPYVTMLTSGPVVDPDTFSPVMTFMTRYGRHYVKNASAYYKSVTFKFEE